MIAAPREENEIKRNIINVIQEQTVISQDIRMKFVGDENIGSCFKNMQNKNINACSFSIYDHIIIWSYQPYYKNMFCSKSAVDNTECQGGNL